MNTRRLDFNKSRLILLIVFLAVSSVLSAQTPSYSCDIRNESFVSPTVFEFDLYLTRTGPTPLELACFNTGIKLNSGFVNGGTITPTLLAGSGLLPTQVPTSIGYDAPTNCIKIAPRQPPRNYTTGVTTGTVLSNTTGTKVCRIRLTNTSAFGTEPVNYTWSINLMPYHTVVSAFVSGPSPFVNTVITNASSHSESNNLVMYLEGLYSPGTGNRKAQDELGDHYAGPVSDQVTVKLAQSTAPYLIEYTATNVNLYANGKCSFAIPGIVTGSYYVVVSHRNSIETWSSTPVDFSGGVVTYDFTDSDTKAYGNNLKQVGSIFTIFAGDVDQDGGIGTLDMGFVDNQSAVFGAGYLAEDVDGDGGVGTLDMGVVDNNSANFVSTITPLGKKKIK